MHGGDDEGEEDAEVVPVEGQGGSDIDACERGGEEDEKENEGSKVELLCSLESTALSAGHRGEVTCLAWSPTAPVLASGGKDNRVILWDARTRRKINALDWHDDALTSVRFSSCGSFVVTTGLDHQAMVWQAQAPHNRLHVLRHNAPCDEAAFLPDAPSVCATRAGQCVTLWHRGEAQQIFEDSLSFAFDTEDGILLGIGSAHTAVAAVYGVNVDDEVGGTRIQLLPMCTLTSESELATSTGVRRIEFATNAKTQDVHATVLTVSGACELFSIPSGSRLAELDRGAPTYCVAFFDLGTRLATGGARGVAVYDLSTPGKVELQATVDSTVFSGIGATSCTIRSLGVRLSPENFIIASTSNGMCVVLDSQSGQVFDVARSSSTSTSEPHPVACLAMCVSNEYLFATATATQRRVALWSFSPSVVVARTIGSLPSVMVDVVRLERKLRPYLGKWTSPA